MRKKFFIFSIFLIFLIFVISMICFIKCEKNNIKNVNALEVSNKKIGWGILRNDKHEQPDLGVKNKEVLEKNQGIAVGNKEEKRIYLTFDEGYEAGYTPEILRVLKEKNVKATFFITAHYLNREPELVEQMIKENHIIGNHTVNHKSLPDISDEEIKKEVMDLHQAIFEKFNYEMKFIRPPKGEFSERTLKTTNNLGYKNVMWSFAYKDWEEKNQPNEENAIKMIVKNFHCGEIMLLHGNSKTNTKILPTIIDEARKEGYEFYSLEEFKK